MCTITALHMSALDLVISLCLCQLDSWSVCPSVCLSVRKSCLCILCPLCIAFTWSGQHVRDSCFSSSQLHMHANIVRFAEAARQHPFAIEDPIQLPHSPSGFDPGDRFNIHKIRLAPLQTRQAPVGIAALQGRPVLFSEGLRSAPGPVAEGLEVDASAASAVSEACMSDAGSSVAGDNPQGSAWGAFKGAFWKRCVTSKSPYDLPVVAVTSSASACQ